MSRRDAFTNLRDQIPKNHIESNSLENSSNSIRQPLDLIPTASRKKKRSRQWEQTHRQETATYRGVPRQVVEKIMDIATNLSVPRDEVVRAFLEYCVNLYQSGEMILYAYPKSQRMTLFPDDTTSTSCRTSLNNQSWFAEAFPAREESVRSKPKNSKKIQIKNPDWKTRVTFRIPPVLKEEVRSIALEHTLPIGELVWFFSVKAMKAYQDGTLTLQPTPKTNGRTLFQESEI